MISLIFKSYFAILISIGLISSLVFALGLYLIFRKNHKTQTVSSFDNHQKPLAASIELKIEPKLDINLPPKKPLTISSQDIGAIAGGDIFATQLDLARAYMETDRKQLAKKMLEFVIAQGSHVQKEEAQRLLSHI